MPNTTLTDLSTVLSSQLSAGSGSARATFGDKQQAFAWVGPTLNAAVAYVASGVALNRNFTATRVENTTPVGPVTDGSQKPVTATLVPVNVSLKTYPGVVEVKTSDAVDHANLGNAISGALYGQCLQALDKDLVAQLKIDGIAVDEAPTLANIAAAQGTLMGNGAFGDLVILDPVTYGTLVGGANGVIQGGNDPRQSQMMIFGARICVSSALTVPTAIVMDSQAAMAIEMDSSPVALVDVHARNNTTDVVIEVIGGTLVTRPDSVIYISDITP